MQTRKTQGLQYLLPIKLFLIAVFLFGYSSSLKIGETCSITNSNCDAGLLCGTCPANGNTRPICTRIQPVIPTTKVKGLPFNKYSWLTTHNSFARTASMSGTGSTLLAPTNQEDSVTDQLKNGVRGLMFDMYDFNGDIWLCHSFGGTCLNITAFQPAINVLKEIQVFLEENPTEIITIFIEDYVTSLQGLTKVFNASGVSKYWFPVSKMPKTGEDWPTVDDMVQNNQRLVVFTSKSSKEASEGIAYEWRYVVENQYGNGGMIPGSCPNRSESSPMNTSSISLVLQNYFPENPNVTEACVDNSAPLASMMRTCYEAAGRRWPNFIAVDFYQVSTDETSSFVQQNIFFFLRFLYQKREILYCRGVMEEEPQKLQRPRAFTSSTISIIADRITTTAQQQFSDKQISAASLVDRTNICHIFAAVVITDK